MKNSGNLLNSDLFSEMSCMRRDNRVIVKRDSSQQGLASRTYEKKILDEKASVSVFIGKCLNRLYILIIAKIKTYSYLWPNISLVSCDTKACS